MGSVCGGLVATLVVLWLEHHKHFWSSQEHSVPYRCRRVSGLKCALRLRWEPNRICRQFRYS